MPASETLRATAGRWWKPDANRVSSMGHPLLDERLPLQCFYHGFAVALPHENDGGVIEVVLVHDSSTLLGHPVPHRQFICRFVHADVVATTASALGKLTENEGNVVVDPKGCLHFVVELHHLVRPGAVSVVGFTLMKDDASKSPIRRRLGFGDLAQNHLVM